MNALLLLLCSIGCTTSTEMSAEKSIEIIVEAQQSPEKAVVLCNSLHRLSTKQDCFAQSAEEALSTDPSLAGRLCDQLQDKAKGDCFFRLAELSIDIGFCAQATPFQRDCQLHILTKRLLTSKVSSFEESEPIYNALGVSLQDKDSQTVLYRHLLSLNSPIPIQKCLEYPHPDQCELSAEGLYVDRLRYIRDSSTFPCTDELGALSHSDHPLLKDIFNRFHRENCP